MYKKCLSHHSMRVSSTVHITYIYISKIFRILQIIFEFLCSKLNNEKPFSFFTKKIFFNKTFFNSTFKLAQYTIIYYFICRIFWLHQFLILPSCLNQLLFSLTENIFRPQWWWVITWGRSGNSRHYLSYIFGFNIWGHMS